MQSALQILSAFVGRKSPFERQLAHRPLSSWERSWSSYQQNASSLLVNIGAADTTTRILLYYSCQRSCENLTTSSSIRADLIPSTSLWMSLRNMSPSTHRDAQVMSRSDMSPRSWARRRYSSFFHGDSVVTGVRKTNSAHTRKAGITLHRPSPTRNEQQATGLRSPTSTRSLIDPSSSPVSTTRSISPNTFERFRRDSNRPVMAHLRPGWTSGELDRAERNTARAIVRPRRRITCPGLAQEKGKRRCLPNIRNPKIRSKLIGCLISGGCLAMMLTICKL